MKDKWRNYALKDGKVKDSYIREYCNRKKIRKAPEASDSHSVEQSRQEQEEVKPLYIEAPPARKKRAKKWIPDLKFP